jgi:putative phosphoribosyl transferase
MAVAIDALRREEPHRIVVACPVASLEASRLLCGIADDCAFVRVPQYFASVGSWYADFRPTTDEEVHDLLIRSRSRMPDGAASLATV